MAESRISGIYEIVNLINGKRYVGSAIDIAKRWREHRIRLRGGYHINRHLQGSWAKHGEDSFVFRLIETCDLTALLGREQFHIDAGVDFNICPTAGSTLGKLHSDYTKKKIGATKVGKKMPPRSDEYRAKLSKVHKGRAKSPEHLAALQRGRRAKVFTEADKQSRSNGMALAYAEGRHRRDRPQEYRDKIANSLREKSRSPEIREQLRRQASEAWARRTVEDRHAHMAKMRAARKQ